MALIDAGLPKPQTNIVVCDQYGEFVARVDIGYQNLRVGVEYDGPQHWTDPKQGQRDIDRHWALVALGWVIIRVTVELLRYREATFIGRVEEAMYGPGGLVATRA